MRDKIKLAAGIIAVIVIMAALFVPTAKKKDDGKIHIRYWYVTGAKELVPYHVSKFNASQDRIVVEPTALPWNEHEKKVLTSILSEDPPDVINLVTPVAKWASRMALVPLDELIKRDSFSDTIFFPALWKEMLWQNRVFAIPLYSNSYAFFYNKKLFRQAGLDPEKPPHTWDEVKEYARRLTKKDAKGNFTQMGFIPQYGNLQTSMLMAWELGADFLSPDGKKVELSSRPLIDALEWEVKYFDEYPLEKVSTFMAGFGYADQHGFLSGKVAMMVLDNTFLDQIKLYTPHLDYGVSMIPAFEGYPPASSSGSWWVAIPRGSKKTEAAWEFIKFAVREDIQVAEANSDEALLFPANRIAANDPAFIKGRSPMRVLVDMMEYAHSPSIVPLAHDIFWREFMGAHERAIHKVQTPEKALKQGEKVIKKQLDLAIEYDEYVRTKMEFQTISSK
jgi:ABC-type glycerol-3-phosphate transport system substrate-binding protein